MLSAEGASYANRPVMSSSRFSNHVQIRLAAKREGNYIIRLHPFPDSNFPSLQPPLHSRCPRDGTSCYSEIHFPFLMFLYIFSSSAAFVLAVDGTEYYYRFSLTIVKYLSRFRNSYSITLAADAVEYYCLFHCTIVL